MNVTWTCPVEVPKSEAFLLSICLRIFASRGVNRNGEQTWRPLDASKTETVKLTRTNAESVLPHFSYLRHKIRCSPFVLSEEDVVDLIDKLVDDEQQAEIVKDKWHEKHAHIREQTRRDLYALADAGFSCVA